MLCDKHQQPMLMISGKYVCPYCLAENRRQPIVFENLAALNEMPKSLRDYRLEQFTQNKNVVTALQKFVTKDLSSFDFRILWLSSNDTLKLSKMTASVCNERLINRMPATYFNASELLMAEFSKLNEYASNIINAKFAVIDSLPKEVSISSNSIINLTFNRLIKGVVDNDSILVITSNYPLSVMMQHPVYRQTLTNYENLIKEVKVK